MVAENLFRSIRVGNMDLSNRNVLAPLTRFRATTSQVPTDLMVEHYRQRAEASPGTLLIAEATLVNQTSGFYAPTTPGVFNKEQIAAWKKVTDAVHKYDGKFFIQLWMLGRASSYEYNKSRGVDYVSASSHLAPKTAVTKQPHHTRALTVAEIRQYVKDYAQGAKNAIEAGADGVEIHGAHGYLVNQFLDPFCNTRTDEYGGSIENRARFLLEIVDAMIEAVGAERVAVRFSPWLNTPIAAYDLSPIPQFSYVLNELERRAVAGNRLAYIHVVEPRVTGTEDTKKEKIVGSNEVWIRLLWKGIIIRAGGMTRELATQFTEDDDKVLIAWGRYYTSNVDLPEKVKENKEFKKYYRKYFYTSSDEGYNDFSKL